MASQPGEVVGWSIMILIQHIPTDCRPTQKTTCPHRVYRTTANGWEMVVCEA